MIDGDFVTEDGFINPVVLRWYRERAELTQEELGQLVGRARTTIVTWESTDESKKRARPRLGIVKLIREKLNIPDPSENLMETLGKVFWADGGEWISYHYTRRAGRPELQKAEWTLFKSGECRMEYIDPDEDEGNRIEEDNRIYEGTVDFEGTSRAVFTMKFEDVKSDIVTWRFPLDEERATKYKLLFEGFWSGVDFAGRDTVARAILTKELISERERNRLLGQDMDVVVYPPTKSNPLDITLVTAGPWDEKKVTDAISACDDGDEIWGCSIYYPSLTYYSAIKDVAQRKTITVKLLFLDPEAHTIVEARARHSEDTSAEKLAGDIRFYSERCRALNQEVGDQSSIEVAYFTAFPYAHFIRIGNKAMYFGLLLPKKSAVKGPMLSVRPDTPSWGLFNQQFQAVWPPSSDPQPFPESHK